MPFIDELNKEKFKTFMGMKFGEDLKNKIQDYIFPYDDSDKEYLINKAFVILKFSSYEEAKLASIALQGFPIMKTNTINAITFMDFDKILNMEDTYVQPDKLSLKELVQWEESNLTEMFIVRKTNSICVSRIHHLKKEVAQIFNMDTRLINNNNIQWSPQGKYLVVNGGNVYILLTLRNLCCSEEKHLTLKSN
jgi:hypothetical protein